MGWSHLAVANVARPPDADTELLEAIEALKSAEKLLADIPRDAILTKLTDLVHDIEAIPQVQLELRISRLRLTARLSSDPDKTPVQHVKGASSQYIAKVAPKPRDDDGNA